MPIAGVMQGFAYEVSDYLVHRGFDVTSLIVNELGQGELLNAAIFLSIKDQNGVKRQVNIESDFLTNTWKSEVYDIGADESLTIRNKTEGHQTEEEAWQACRNYLENNLNINAINNGSAQNHQNLNNGPHLT